MKTLLTLFASLALAVGAQAQVIRNGFTVFLPAAPPTTQDCRFEFYNLAVDNNQTLWVCNTANGNWTANNSAGVTVTSGKVLTVSNSLTLAGTDSTTMTFPTTSATLARTDAANTFTGVQTFSSAPVLSTGTITNTGTITMPTNTGGVPVLYGCGASSGNATCANTSGGATARVLTGLATLASNSAVISGISPAFTGTTTFSCTSNDQTTIGNPTKVLNTSSSSITISDTTGASDVVSYVCVGY